MRFSTIYKSIFLSLLLISNAIAYSNVDTRTQQLKENLFQKELALSKIGKEIEQQEELIASMNIKIQETLTKVFTVLKKEEERKEYVDQIIAFSERCDKVLKVPNVNSFFIDELFKNNTNHIDETERIKSLLIRKIIEKEILKRLIKKYEELFQEAAILESEIEALEKLETSMI